MRKNTLRLVLITPLLLIHLMGTASAQSDAGKIKGKVVDETGYPFEFVTVVILDQNRIIKAGAITDENGLFTVSPVSPGKYKAKIKFAGNMVLVENVTVSKNKTVDLKQININTGVEMQ